ncbi:MAG TPA: tartrate-resistant acid phosphatase type 5 family protein [Thermoanaerobaculia bacterium]
MLRLLAGAALLAAAVFPPGAAGKPAMPAGGFEFLVLGDWGRGGDKGQKPVAAAMAAWADARPVRFVVSTGDNFYEDGVASVTDPKWKASFEDVYTARSLQVPWFISLGNHDYRGSVEAQVGYSKRSLRWKLPARYYTVVEALPDGTRLQLFVLDTTPFLGTYRSFVSRTKVGGQDPAAQRAWLEKELAASTAEWKVVVGHHTVYSCGPHGDSAELVRGVVPLFDRTGVALYVNGHDHGLQDLVVGGRHYVTSGAGSELTRVAPDGRTRWAAAVNGFVAVAVARDALVLRFVDALGAVRHEASIPRPAPAP